MFQENFNFKSFSLYKNRQYKKTQFKNKKLQKNTIFVKIKNKKQPKKLRKQKKRKESLAIEILLNLMWIKL